MHAIKQLHDQELLQLAKQLAARERSQLVTVLHCFAEVEARKLFAAN